MSRASLHVRLLGELEFRLDGEPLPPPESVRARSLVAWLLLHRDVPQPRRQLAFHLWPDSTERQARTNLRHLLHNLRQAAPALLQFIDVGRATLTWRTDGRCWLDVAAFEEALADGGDVARLEEAIALYRGELLPDCYDDWIATERERLRRLHVHALGVLTERLAAGHKGAAIRYARELVRHDPLDERSYVLLMRLHADRGDRAQALQTYHLCAATLERELGVEPDATTRELYEALLPAGGGARTAAAPVEAAGSPLVGRTAAWERLTALWRVAERGQAQLAAVMGEPGIGKTRLVTELRSWCARRGAVVAEARCYGAEGETAFAPVVAWLRSDALRPTLQRATAADRAQLAQLLSELDDDELQAVQPLLGEAEQRARLFAAASRVIAGAAGPLLLVLDDAQWCDRQSLQFVHQLVRSCTDLPLLLVLTARPGELAEDRPLHDLLLGIQRLDRLAQLELTSLSRDETTALAGSLLGEPLTAAGADRLYAETEGNPLFIVEAVRAGWSSGDPGTAWIAPRVQGVIRYRLAQLTEPARRLAGVAATIGRAFAADVLEQASGVDAETFVRSLDELWRARIVRESGDHGYDFTHDKIREVAYTLLSPARRRHNHRAVADALVRLYAPDPGPLSASIAAHCDRGGRSGDALHWYRAAAESAQRLHDSGEAVRLLERALELNTALPAEPGRSTTELALLTALLTPLANRDGFMSSRLREAQQRGAQLARQLGVEPPPQFLASIALAALARDELALAQQVGSRLRARAQADADPALLLESDYVLGIVAFWQGELRTARRHFEEAAAAGPGTRRHSHLLRAWLDPQVVCTSRLANTLWFLGDDVAACRTRDAALAAAAELGHRPTCSATLMFAALLALEMGETERIRTYLDAIRAEQDSAGPWAVRLAGDLLRGYLLAVDGQAAAGLEAIRAILDDPRGADHAPGMRAVGVRLLMAAHAAARDDEGRLAAADRMLALDGAGRLWEAEARRARAESLAALGAPAALIEAELQHAIAVARRQGARMLEARAEAAFRRLRAAAAP